MKIESTLITAFVLISSVYTNAQIIRTSPDEVSPVAQAPARSDADLRARLLNMGAIVPMFDRHLRTLTIPAFYRLETQMSSQFPGTVIGVASLSEILRDFRQKNVEMTVAEAKNLKKAADKALEQARILFACDSNGNDQEPSEDISDAAANIENAFKSLQTSMVELADLQKDLTRSLDRNASGTALSRQRMDLDKDVETIIANRQSLFVTAQVIRIVSSPYCRKYGCETEVRIPFAYKCQP